MSSKSVVVVVAGEDHSGAVLDAVNKHLEEVRKRAEEADASMGQFGATAMRALERMGIYFGAREIIRGMEELIKHSVDLGMEIGHLSKQTGISTENLSVLKYASDQTGVSFETLTKGFKKFSEEIFNYEHGSKQAKQAFDGLNISQRDLNATGGDLYKMLELVAGRVQAMPDGFQKNAIATQLFGRAGQELIPVLDQGSAGIESFRSEAEGLGLVLDSQTIGKMEELHKSIAAMEGSFSGLALEITSALSPALEKMAHDASELVRAFQFSPKDGLKLMASNFLSNIGAPGSRAMADSDRLRAEALADMKKQADADAAAHAKDSAAQTAKGAHPGVTVNDEAAADKLRAAVERWQLAKTQLQEQYAKLDEDRAKAHAEMMLAELDSAHKRALVSDVSYYTQKEDLQNKAFDAEVAAVHRQQDALTQQSAEIRGRKAKDAADAKKNETEILELNRQYLALDGQILQIDSQRQKANAEIAAASQESLEKSREQSAELAAELERLQGAGAMAQIDASQTKYQEKRRQLSTQYGSDSPEVRELDAIQKLEEAKLRLEALDERISAIQTQEKMQELQLEEQVLGRKISQAEYDRELQGLREQEIAQLKALQGEYNAVADGAGKAGQEAKAKLEESITGVEQSMQQLRQSFTSELMPILQELEMHPKKWQENFRHAADMIEKDLLRIANARLMESLGLGESGSIGKNGNPTGGGLKGMGGLSGILGKLAGLGHEFGGAKASNGGYATGAGTLPDATTSLLQQGGGSGSAGAPVINLITQGTPQTVDSSGSSGGGGKLEQMIVSIVLKDADTLGPMTQAIGGGINMLGNV